MKQWLWSAALLGGLACAVFGTTHANAEYPSSNSTKASTRGVSGGSEFEDAVNVTRFRKGNPEWDSQELMVSGMKALHQEHQEILKELEEIKSAMQKLAAEQKQ